MTLDEAKAWLGKSVDVVIEDDVPCPDDPAGPEGSLCWAGVLQTIETHGDGSHWLVLDDGPERIALADVLRIEDGVQLQPGETVDQALSREFTKEHGW